MDKNSETALGRGECTDQILFSETAEDQTNQHGGGGEVKLFCQITDYTENDGDKTVINRVAAGIGARQGRRPARPAATPNREPYRLDQMHG